MPLTVLCPAPAIAPGQCKQFDLAGTKLFVVHYLGSFYGYLNRCPHLGIELQWQPDRFLDYDGELIQCASHGALFLIEDGECVSGPCRGARLQAIPVCVQDGQLLVDL